MSPADDAFVVYTSGSTATPKAVVHGQRSVVTKPRALAPIFLMDGDDRTLSLLPAFWLGGIAAALQVLCTGSTLVYPPTPQLDDVLDMIERHDVTYVVVWHALAKLRAAAKARGIDVDRIRGMGSRPRDEHGEPIPPALRANLLGMSESFSAHSGEPIDRRLPADKEGSSGRAINGIERRVVDPETGEEVAPGEVGELQLRGGGLMTGFYKVDRDEVFTPDGFYPTKDLVRIDADGYLWFVGRTGDMIKTSSANVSRLEVEAALNALPEVALSFVAGLPDPDLGELVVAAVIPAPGAEPTEDGLRAALRDRLSSFKIPRRIVFITRRRRSADADRQGAPVRPGDDDRGAPGRRPGRGGPMITLTNAHVFDGRAMLPGRHDVTLDGKRIASISEHAGIVVGRGGRRRRHDRAPRAHQLPPAPRLLQVRDRRRRAARQGAARRA